MIDWEMFAARVPAGTRFQIKALLSQDNLEGIILENYPFAIQDISELSRNIRCQFFAAQRDSPAYMDPLKLKYFIDNQFQTYQEIMQS